MKTKCRKVGCFEPSDCRHGYCVTHCFENHRKLSYDYRPHPKTSEPHIGVEIEVEFRTEEDLKRAIPLKATTDGSLGSYSGEFKVLAPSQKIIQKASRLLEELWKRKAIVSPRCGLHVHIDVRYQAPNRLIELFDWCRHTQDVWFNLMPQSRRDNSYVRKLGKIGGTIPKDHYDWIHQTIYNTIEVRLHGGTVNPYKLEGWLSAMIHLQRKIMDSSFSFPTHPVAKTAFMSLFSDAPNKAREYINARQNNNGVIQDYAFQRSEE